MTVTFSNTKNTKLRHEDAPAMLSQLERLSEILGIDIRYEELSPQTDSIQIRSGLIRLRRQRLLIVDSRLTAYDKCRVISYELREHDLRHVFISPAVRRMIESSRDDAASELTGSTRSPINRSLSPKRA